MNSCDFKIIIVSMKTGLFTSVVVCIFVCVLFIKLLSVDARCWVDCSDYQYNVLLPYCYLNDDESDRTCSIQVSTSELTELRSQNWTKVNLFVNVTHSVDLRVTNGLSDYKLELRAFRKIDQVTKLEIYYKYLIMSHQVLYNLRNLRYMFCHEVSFSHFPSFTDNSKLTYLGLYYIILSNDTKIRSGLISGLSNLKYLTIHPRNRGKLANNALTGLTALTTIYLRNIVLSDYVNTLSPLVRLKYLYFQDSMLSDITFLKQTPGLYGLTYISFGNNKIKSFPADTFKNYTQLVLLNMGYNSISIINRFHSKNLKKLYLDNNQITHVPEDTFRDTPLLSYIRLYNNDITRLSSRTFEHLDQIKYIFLYNNPLQCDCGLRWLYNVNQEYSIQFKYQLNNFLCATPPQHEGISALNSSLYTNCDEELSYQCFDRTISCPVGSYCQDTRDSYKCVCEGEGVAFSRTLNQCVDIESMIENGSCCKKGQAVCTEPL